MRATTTDSLLDAAESRVRRFGYNGFSFRDLAADVGIKSASVHHHFPTKGELGARLARRYTDRFLAELGDPSGADGAGRAERLARFVAPFRRSLAQGNRMCLCGALAAEAGALPPEVAAEAGRFFAAALDWLVTAFGGTAEARAEAALVLAALEGGLVLARGLGDAAAFERVVERLRGREAAVPGH